MIVHSLYFSILNLSFLKLRNIKTNKNNKKNLSTQDVDSRLFFSIFPPNEYISFFKDVLKEYTKEKRNIDTIPLDKIHINIKFLGANVTQQSRLVIVDRIRQLVNTFTIPEIAIKKIQFGFDHQSNPSIIVAELFNTKTLLKFSNELHELIKKLGLRDTVRWKDKYFNKFHISIAKIKPKLSISEKKRILQITKNINIKIPNPFLPNNFYLVRSEANPNRNIQKYFIENIFSF